MSDRSINGKTNGHSSEPLPAGATDGQGLGGGPALTTRQGHPVYEIFSSMAPNAHDPVVAPIDLTYDHERRQARIRIPDLAESEIEPIRNPVTGDEHRARIDLPNGFEYRLAEVANSKHWRTTAGDHLAMEHENTYAQIAHIDWSSDGTTR